MNTDQHYSLPITLVCGPTAPAFARELARTQTTHRLGVLTSSQSDWHTGLKEPLARGNLKIFRLDSNGTENHEFIQCLTKIAREGAVDRLLIECPAGTHPAPIALLLRDAADSSGAGLSSVVLAITDATVSNLASQRWTDAEPPLLVAEQIEFASAVALGATNGEATSKLGLGVIAALNPRTRIFQNSETTIADQLLATSTPFSIEAAFKCEWIDRDPNAPTSGDSGIETFTYLVDRPFHPERFWQFLQKPSPGVFRAKGLFWLATRLEVAGGLNMAGTECRHGPAGAWESEDSKGQALSFLGKDLDKHSLRAELDRCLLNDQELAADKQSWTALPDPFPSWQEEAHDHDCEHHDCSCH